MSLVRSRLDQTCPACGTARKDQVIDPRTVSQDWIARNPHHAQALLRALGDAVARAQNHQLEALREALALTRIHEASDAYRHALQDKIYQMESV
jgi:hypothetical protein